MPIWERSEVQGVPEQASLRAELIAELRNQNETGEPVIIIERTHRAMTRLYVVWTKWNNIDQRVRSGIILDAFAEVRGKEAAENVTIAFGLTPEEADRLDIKWRVGS